MRENGKLRERSAAAAAENHLSEIIGEVIAGQIKARIIVGHQRYAKWRAHVNGTLGRSPAAEG